MTDSSSETTFPGRPRYHYSPPSGWLNDPNGLVFIGGEYHLFYQHHPNSDRWGPMHWGHAVSTDLVRWTDLPMALEPDDLGWIYSGSAVVDHGDTAGFGRDAIVAVFTHASAEGQVQSLAYSLDLGRSWRTYDRNPVLPAPPDTPDFRDPKVFRWDGQDSEHWVMVLAVGPEVAVFTSKDMRTWSKSSGLLPCGTESTVVETPDLFPLRVGDDGEQLWVLSIGVTSGAPAGGGGTGYLVGSFDGQTFTPGGAELLWADFGTDFYAAQSWSNSPGDERVWIAWLSDWAYAEQVPSSGWRGVMTIPRRLELIQTSGGVRLAQTPTGALNDSRVPRHSSTAEISPGSANPLAGIRCRRFDLELGIGLDASTASRLELEVFKGDHERTAIIFDIGESALWLDRSHAGADPFHHEHPLSARTTVDPPGGLLKLRVIGDECSVEVFANSGEVSISALVYPESASDGFALRAIGGTVAVETIGLFEISV